MSYKILVTGCGGDIGQSIGKILKSHAMFDKVIGCDMSSENASIFIFDKVFNIPSCKSSDYISTLQSIIKNESIDILLPISEAELRYFADCEIGQLIFKIPMICANLKAMKIGFDKYETMLFLKGNGLPFPETILVKELNVPSLPLILKSRTGAGSKSIYLIEDIDDFIFYKKKFPEFITQEFLENSEEEYTCGVFRSSYGEVRTIVYRRKLTGGFSGYGIVEENDLINRLLVNIATNIELKGSINVQLRLVKKGPCIFEINPRFSSTVKFRHMMGFQDVIWSIEDIMGIQISSYEKVKKGIKFYKGFSEYVS